MKEELKYKKKDRQYNDKKKGQKDKQWYTVQLKHYTEN